MEELKESEAGEIQDKTKEQQLEALKDNETKLSDYLQAYQVRFGDGFEQLDQLWMDSDKDQNGFLQKEEAKADFWEWPQTVPSICNHPNQTMTQHASSVARKLLPIQS